MSLPAVIINLTPHKYLQRHCNSTSIAPGQTPPPDYSIYSNQRLPGHGRHPVLLHTPLKQPTYLLRFLLTLTCHFSRPDMGLLRSLGRLEIYSIYPMKLSQSYTRKLTSYPHISNFIHQVILFVTDAASASLTHEILWCCVNLQDLRLDGEHVYPVKLPGSIRRCWSTLCQSPRYPPGFAVPCTAVPRGISNLSSASPLGVPVLHNVRPWDVVEIRWMEEHIPDRNCQNYLLSP